MSLMPPQAYRKTEYTHRIGVAADRPAAADVLIGTLYFSTDTLTLERSNGATWDSYSPSGSPASSTPTFLGLMGEQGEDGENGIIGSPAQFAITNGLWTPELTGDGGAAVGTTYTTQEGHYYKIGNFVQCWGLITVNAIGAIPGNLMIGGFPFTSANPGSAGIFGNGPLFWANWTTAFVLMQSSMVVNDTRAYIVAITAASTTLGVTVTDADLAVGSQVRINLSYFT